jgi:cytochrome c2
MLGTQTLHHRRGARVARAALACVGLAASALAVVACDGGLEDDHTRTWAAQLTGGEPERGRTAIRRYGCEACHEIPGVRGARSLVGPSLSGIASRMYIAGVLANTPTNMELWIRAPRAVDSLTAMPDVGVTPGDARDIASYLYTLK